jgi:outer membrane protein OmpA-like peptidoglycan-associated protein
MKRALMIAGLVTGTFLCACAELPISEVPKTRVSGDYEVAGDASGMRAFVYGKRTVLEFSRRPLWLAVQDENGVAVAYEREGHYYRLARKLNRCTVWVNARVVSFTPIHRHVPAIAPEAAVSAEPAAHSARPEDATPTTTPSATIRAAPTPEDDATSLLRLSAAQLNEVRYVIAAEASDVAEARALNARVRHVAQALTIDSVMLRVQFGTASTELTADDSFVRTLVPAARAAERIILRGRTDARIAGSDDASIALGRVLAVRQLLVEHGVDGRKIRVSALAAGDFLAPASTNAGRALNRRVEIELVDHRYAELTREPERGQRVVP